MTKSCYIMCAAVLFIVTAGCAGQSRVGRDFGNSYRLAVANQTLNPDAGQTTTLVEGLDSRAVQNAYDQYLKSFDKVQKEPTYLLGVGGLGGTSK